MRGRTLPFATMKPEARPHSRPTPVPMARAARTEVEGSLRTTRAAAMPDRAITAPIERSMPPEIMTIIIPTESAPRIELFMSMSERLSAERN